MDIGTLVLIGIGVFYRVFPIGLVPGRRGRHDGYDARHSDDDEQSHRAGNFAGAADYSGCACRAAWCIFSMRAG